MLNKIKNFLRDIFAPRVTVYKNTYSSKNFPTKEFDSMFKHMGEMFEDMGDMFKKL